MSSLQIWGKRVWNSCMAAMQPSSSSRTISTPRPARKPRSPAKVWASPTTTRGIWKSRMAPVHIWHGERGVQGGVEVGGAPAGVAQAGDLAVRHRVAALHALVVPGRDDVTAGR